MGKLFQRFVLLLAVFAAIYFLLHPQQAVSSASAKSETEFQTVRDASTLYDQSCATCHGKDGRAQSFRGKHTHARDLTDPKWQEDASDERIFNSISNGKEKMPAFGKKFSEAEINALVAYVRHLKR